ncbi:MAG: sugar phosphate isomerase/epimerase [Clostridia bacterium]|nr:sugar phosphate isomerase/epimerase [Clostridia bacterium]
MQMEWAYQISSLKPLLKDIGGVRNVLAELRRIGFKTLQLQWIDRSVDDEAVKEALLENGFTCIGIQEKTEDALQYMERCFRQMSLWQAEYFTISGIPEENMSRLGIYLFAWLLRQIDEEAEKIGARVTFHPLSTDYRKVDKVCAVYRLLEETGDRIQITPDFCHINRAGLSCSEIVRRYAGRCDLVHYKSYKKLPDGTVCLTPLGKGDQNWQEEYRACVETKVKYGFIEQEVWEGDPFDAVRESYDYAVKLR